MAEKRSGSGNSQRIKSAKSSNSVSDAVSRLTVKALQSLNMSEIGVSNTSEDAEEPIGDRILDEEVEEVVADIQIPSSPDDDDIQIPTSPGDGDIQILTSPGDGDIQIPSSPGDGDFAIDYDIEQTSLINEEEDVHDSGMDAGLASDSEDDAADNEATDNDLIVLDPDHPLMKRFQKAYKQHLWKQDQKSSLKLKELSEEHSNYQKQREEVGVELYGLQQELARQQLMLEKHHDQYNEENQIRLHWEMRLNEAKGLHKQVFNDVQQQRKKANEMQTEVENLTAKVLYMEAAKEDVRSDINVLKRAADKAQSEATKAHLDKKRQDMLVNRLVTRVDRLRGEIVMYEAQIEAQKEEMKAATRSLTEAATELEAIELEKKQLLQQWNNSLVGMRRRDEARAAVQEAVNLQSQHVMAVEKELEGYRRQITKAQEQNEQLTYMHNRIQSDISTVKKQIVVSQNKQEVLRIEYSKYNRALGETEQQLNRAHTEVISKESELVALRNHIEKEFTEKQKLEDEILLKMQEQLTADKASQYTKKMTEKVRRNATQAERSVAEVENDISKVILEISNATTRVRGLQEILNNINNIIYEKSDTIAKIENEIVKRNATIEKKQGTIDYLKKKIHALINKNGDDAFVGPLELQIKTLQRQIESSSNKCLELQQYWLRQQSELVRVIKEVNEEGIQIDSKNKQSTILLQKKLRTEGEINSQKNEIKDIDRNIRYMQNDMSKLNILIHKNRDKQQSLEQDNILIENDFVSTLKDAELQSVKMQANIQGLNEEKERLLNALIEAERQIMLWEKKTQLAREARDAVDSDIGQGEMHTMKAEIHRMEVRYAQLMRQQEKMIQDMEKSVSKRESIIVRGDAMATMERKKIGKPKLNVGNYHKKMSELKKKIKQTNQDASTYEEEIKVLRDEQRDLSLILEEKQTNTQKLQQSIDLQQEEMQRMNELKQKNLSSIITKQQRGKYYTSLKAGKYSRLCKTPSSLSNEKDKQMERLQSVSSMVERIIGEYPEIQAVFRSVRLSIGNFDEPNDRSVELDLAS